MMGDFVPLAMADKFVFDSVLLDAVSLKISPLLLTFFTYVVVFQCHRTTTSAGYTIITESGRAFKCNASSI